MSAALTAFGGAVQTEFRKQGQRIDQINTTVEAKADKAEVVALRQQLLKLRQDMEAVKQQGDQTKQNLSQVQSNSSFLVGLSFR